MAITVEIVGSQSANVSLDNPTQEILYLGIGDDNFVNMKQQVEAQLEPTVDIASNFFGNRHLVLQGYEMKHLGAGHWDIRATYGRRPPRATGDLYLSFDGTGATQHITTSKDTIERYSRAVASPNPPGGFVGALNAGGSLPIGTTIYFVVTAVNAAGVESLQSNVELAATPVAGNQSLALSWGVVPGASSYRVYYSTTSRTYNSPALIATTSLATVVTIDSVNLFAGAPPTEVQLYEQVPDLKRAIGVNNRTVEGCDITIPAYKFTFNYYPSISVVTIDYVNRLLNLTGKTNDAPWFGFDAGELLFMGPSGQPRGLDDWEILLHIMANPSAEGFMIGDVGPVNKDGWEYLWVQFVDSIDQNCLIKVPRFAFVERVYDAGSFSDLGIDGLPVQGLGDINYTLP
jgi:hypothetical protein